MQDRTFVFLYSFPSNSLDKIYGSDDHEVSEAVIHILNEQLKSESSGLILFSGDSVILSFVVKQEALIVGVPKLAFMEALIGSPEFNRLFTLGTLVGKISHEFNNTLTGLAGHSSYVCEVADDLDIKKSVEFIKDGIERGILLTKELVLFSKPTSRIERFSIKSFFDRLKLWTKIIAPPNIKIEFNNGAENFVLETDSVKLNQVFINLVLNSVQAIDGEGIIRINSRVENDSLIFEIVDTGKGIKSEDLKHIFKPYFTSKPSGTGLGCYISKTLVDDLGGEIRVSSTVGKGSVFSIIFKENFYREDKSETRVESAANTAKILLVDDDENVREVLRMGLKHDGFVVEAADGYDSAISLAKNMSFDVAVVDIIMPGKNGLETAKDLLEIQPKIKIVVISGYSPPETISAFKNLGVSVFLHKPFAISELSAAIRSQLK